MRQTKLTRLGFASRGLRGTALNMGIPRWPIASKRWVVRSSRTVPDSFDSGSTA